MQAKSIKGNSIEEITGALQQCLADHYRPTLAIVFISISHDRNAVCEILHEEGIDIIGATSCGEFINGYQGEGSIVILLLDLPPDTYTILYEEIGHNSLSDASTALTKLALEKFERPGFILLSTGFSKEAEYLDGDILIRGIEKDTGSWITVCGGMAGDDGTFTGTYVFTYGKETDRGIVALVLNEDKISVQGMAISGWKPLGISRTITKSKGNLVYTIDGQPAPELYLRFLGEERMSKGENIDIMQSIGMHYPFLLQREVGEPVLRTPMSIDKDQHALVCDLDMPEGAAIRFSMPPDFDIVDKIIEEANQLKNKHQFEAEALLVFSCAGRVQVLGPLANAENEGLYNVWQAPMAGFFTYGEYGKTINGKPEFHSGTNSWVVLKEKTPNPDPERAGLKGETLF
jgi:hypothetical protein